MKRFFLEINNVLIIDDESITIELKPIIEQSGYQTFVARSWAAALVQLAANNIDVIFCDLQFPGDISGDQVLQLVQLHYPNIRVVLMGEHLSDDVCDGLLSRGAACCVEKPVYQDECQEIMLLLEEQQFFQSADNSGW